MIDTRTRRAATAMPLAMLLGMLFAAPGQAPPEIAVPRPAPVPEPADRFVTVNGLRIHYVEWGDPARPPLVLIHGLDRVARTFDHLVPFFVDRYRVIAYDMRGHGDSGWDPEGRYLVEDHVGDLEGLVQVLGLRDIVVWGNSTGGRVAQVFTALHPGLVSHLVSEDVGPERPRAIAESYARRVTADAGGWASEDEVAAALRKSNPTMAEAVVTSYARHASRRGPDGRVIWKRDPNLVKGFVETDLWRFVGAIRTPALYVLGGRSTIVPPETQARLRKTLPRVEIVTMPGLGHFPSDERPAEFAAIVNRFLRD